MLRSLLCLACVVHFATAATSGSPLQDNSARPLAEHRKARDDTDFVTKIEEIQSRIPKEKRTGTVYTHSLPKVQRMYEEANPAKDVPAEAAQAQKWVQHFPTMAPYIENFWFCPCCMPFPKDLVKDASVVKQCEARIIATVWTQEVFPQLVEDAFASFGDDNKGCGIGAAFAYGQKSKLLRDVVMRAQKDHDAEIADQVDVGDMVEGGLEGAVGPSGISSAIMMIANAALKYALSKHISDPSGPRVKLSGLFAEAIEFCDSKQCWGAGDPNQATTTELMGFDFTQFFKLQVGVESDSFIDRCVSFLERIIGVEENLNPFSQHSILDQPTQRGKLAMKCRPCNAFLTLRPGYSYTKYSTWASQQEKNCNAFAKANRENKFEEARAALVAVKSTGIFPKPNNVDGKQQ